MANRQGAVLEAEQDEAIDLANEHGHADDTQGSEGELELARKVAKRLGWTPLEDWKRDPEKWVDADRFLEETPRQIDTLKERLKRTGQAAEDAIEEERRRARIEAQAELRRAAEANDPDAAVAAGEKLARASGPSPDTVSWLAANRWFETDHEAAAVARAAINRVHAEGGSIRDQLAEAEKVVRKRYPEHFETPRETRLSDVRKEPPQVASGNRGPATTPKDKSWTEIPRADRDQAEKHFLKRFMGRGMTQDQARAKYAASYWANKE